MVMMRRGVIVMVLGMMLSALPGGIAAAEGTTTSLGCDLVNSGAWDTTITGPPDFVENFPAFQFSPGEVISVTLTVQGAGSGGGSFHIDGLSPNFDLLVVSSGFGPFPDPTVFQDDYTVTDSYTGLNARMGAGNGDLLGTTATSAVTCTAAPDTTAPTITCPTDPSVTIGAGGNVTITPGDVGVTATDDVGIASLFLIPNNFSVTGDFEVEATAVDTAGNLASCTFTLTVLPLDSDGDGVLDPDDVCPATVVPDEPTDGLKKNRFAADASGAFLDGEGTPSGYTLVDTGGCSATQIIERAELGTGHTRFGISRSALEAWIASLS
jgi:hypothetical protein